jgi:hypothetical protein
VKTISLKKVSAVAVASLGFGLLSVVPANAAIGATTELNMVVAGSTTAATPETGTYVTASADEVVYVRSTTATNIFNIGAAVAVSGNVYNIYLSNATAAATTANLIAITASGTPSGATVAAQAITTDDAVASANTKGLAFTTGSTSVTNMKFTTGALAAGTYYLYVDATADTTSAVLIATITSYDVGVPTTASYSKVGYTKIGSAADVTATISVKDSSSRSTFLVGDETLVSATLPLTAAAAPAVTAITASATVTAGSTPTPTSGVFAGYSVTIEGDTASLTKNQLYTQTTTITTGTNAAGSASVTYRYADTTSAISGGSITYTDATSAAVLTSIATAASLASTAADVITVKDAAGALVIGVTPVATASTGTVSAAVGITGDAGTNTAFRFTAPATAGTSTVTFSLPTGSTTMSTSVAFVTTAFGATAAVTTTAVRSVVKGDGSGIVMTSTAPTTNAWDAALNVSSITATIGGLDAGKAAKLTLSGTNTGGTINTVAGPIYPVATAAGEITFKLGVTSAVNGNQLIVNAAADGTSNILVLTITFTTAANALTTSPATSSLSMSTPSATKAISATVADQYGNAITGGSFKLTNTVVPTGATAAAVVNVNADAAGKATLNAVLGATLGTYTFTVDALTANAGAIGSTSSITFSVTTTGIAGTLTLTDTDNSTGELTTDDKGSRTIVVAANAVASANVVVGGGLTDSATAITVTTATPSALAFTATATNGIRLFTTTPNGAAIAVGKSEVTGTAGSSANLWAVPTKASAGTITVVSGGLTKVYTLTGTAAAAGAIKSAFVTLVATSTIGQYTVKATDLFGNGLVSDVAITLAGPGSFSNGFKNLTVTTGADGTNTFNVVSDGSAATTVKAVLASGTYLVISAANAKTAGIVGLGTDGATTDTATVSMTGKGGTSDSATLAGITALIDALNAKIVALNALIAKIMRKLGVK